MYGNAALSPEFQTEIADVPAAAPGPGQILVRIQASVMPTPSADSSHEYVAIVEQLGAGVTQHEVGDVVVLRWLSYACGSCCYCLSGWETLCVAHSSAGHFLDGVHEEHLVVDARFAVAALGT
jgi:propanol-preferring alcohol dehydrogenase